jgi:hypothetical protein
VGPRDRPHLTPQRPPPPTAVTHLKSEEPQYSVDRCYHFGMRALADNLLNVIRRQLCDEFDDVLIGQFRCSHLVTLSRRFSLLFSVL